MIRHLRLLPFLFLLLNLNTGLRAQCGASSAVSTITLQCSGGASFRCGIAYNPSHNLYYSVNGGAASLPLETFAATGGNALSSVSQGVDYRGYWWNPTTGKPEGNVYSNGGVYSNALNASFYATTTTSLETSMNMPDIQSCGAYDYTNNYVVYYDNGAIYKYNRSGGALVSTVNITGLPVSTGNLNSSSILYTGIPGAQVGVYDYINKAVYFIDYNTGIYVSTCSLPASAPAASYGNMSYANNLIFLYDTGTSRWYGYQIVTPTCTGAALAFDGTNDGVVLPDFCSSWNLGNNFSFELWIKPNSLANSAILYAGLCNSACEEWKLTIGPGQSGCYDVGTTGRIVFSCGSLGGFVQSDASPTTGAWTHVAVTYNGVAVKMYVNGTLQSSVLTTTASVNSSQYRNIGGDPGCGFRFPYNGAMDELRFWNRALCPSEITNNMSCPVSSSATGITGLYRFNQGVASGANAGITNLTDASTGAATGTLINFGLTGSASNWVWPGGFTSTTTCGAINVPDILITGNGVTISPGNTVTSSGNNTSFGSVGTGSSLSYTYVIKNTGSAALTISSYSLSGSGASSFSITTNPAASVASSGSTAIVVKFAPASTGLKQATLTINSNDCDESPYIFAIDGTGVTPGAVLNFDGSDDKVIIGSGVSLNNQSFTVEFWAKHTNTQSGYVAGQGNSIGTNQSLHIGFRAAPGNEFTFAFYSNDINYTTTATTDGNFHHWACVFDNTLPGTNRFVYLDGVLVASDRAAALQATGPFVIGDAGYWSSFPNPFKGSIDELRIWNTARTQCQIQTYRNCEISGAATGLVANYHFNQGVASGSNSTYSVLTDDAGINTNPTLSNFALTGSASNWITPGAVTSGSTTTSAPLAAISVSGNGSAISYNSSSASLSNFTDFGTAFTRTFVIQNSGTTVLNPASLLITGTNASEFSITALPSVSVAASGSTSFVVAFTPTLAGSARNATIQIDNNDCSKPIFSFAITGSVAVGAALNFDGTNDFAAVSYTQPTTNITNEFWFKTTNGNQGLFSLVSGTPTTSIGGYDRDIYLSSGNLYAYLWLGGPTEYINTTGTNYADGNWHHVAHVIGGSQGAQKLYVDGLLKATGTATASSFNTNSYVLMGYSPSTFSTNLYFNGSIDDVRLWTVARSQCEIQSYMNCEIPTTTGNLAANFHFNQGLAGGSNPTVTTATNATGGNNAVLSNFTLTGSTSNWISPGGVTSGSTTPATLTSSLIVTGNSATITAGAASTSTLNFTDFGSASTRTFVVKNVGTGSLYINNSSLSGANASGFSITTVPSASLGTSGSSSLVVTFNPPAPGSYSAIVNILSSDCSASNYSFAITASVSPAAALNFDGTNDAVNIAHNAVFNFSGAITVESWVKTTSTSERYITSKFNDSWYLAINGNSAAPGKASFFINGVSSAWMYGSSNVSDGNWHHIAATYNGSFIKLYVDGILEAQTAATGTISQGPAQVQLGSRGNTLYFNGSLDEIRFWNIARTQCDIQSYMNAEITSTASGLVANYHFNQGLPSGSNATVTTLTDAAGSNNGTLTSFSLTGSSSNWVSPGGVTSGSTTPASITASLAVSGNGNNVPVGATTSTTNNTDFGTNTSRTFSITNTGGGTLAINSVYFTGPNAAQFSITTTPTTALTTGTTGFVVAFTPTSSGANTATVNIPGNDCAHPSFSFVITASAPLASALNFDGADDYVQGPAAPGIPTLSAFTMEGWVNLNNTTNSKIFSSAEIELAVVANSLQAYSSAFGTVYDNFNLSTGVWKHVAITYDGSSVKFFLNGAFLSSSPATGTIPANSGYKIGKHVSVNCCLFNGSMDELRLWTVARSQCEIQQFMNAEITSTASGLVMNYHFNQGAAGLSNLTTTLLTDASGSSNTGTLTNFALTGSTSNWTSPGGVVSGFTTSVPPSVEIDIKGNGVSITDGSSSPQTSNSTDFGATCSNSVISKTFTIQNTGAAALTVQSGTITGANASSFTLSTLPASVSASGSATFAVSFSATASGSNNATLHIISNDCDESDYDFAITASVGITPTIAVTGSAICQGQTFTITPTGAANYTYSGGSATVSPSTTTSYSVTGTSTLGCPASNTAAVTITVNTLPTVGASSSTTQVCAGNSVTVNGSGASTYTWIASVGTATNNTAFSPGTTASYSVSGTSTAGCTSTNVAAVTITVNALPTVSANTSSTQICQNASVTLTGSGASTYTWTGGAGTVTNGVAFSPTATASYTVAGTSTAGCTSTNVAAITITVNTLPTVSAGSSTTQVCAGGSLTLNGSGTSTYTWSSPSGTLANNTAFSPTATASYTVVGTSTAGCTSTNVAALSITVNALPIVGANTSTNQICAGNNVTLNGSGASTYTWTGGASTVTNGVAFSPAATASYSVSGTSTAGCTSTNSAFVTVTVNALPVLTITASSPSVCINNSVTLTASSASTYTWTGGATTVTNGVAFSPTATASYSVSGTSTAGCASPSAAVTTITVNLLPTVGASSSASVICTNATISLSGSGANTYTWSSPSGTLANLASFSPTATASYTVSGTSTAGCTSTNVAAVTVTVNALPSLTIASTSSAICIGGSVALSASGASTYTWTGGAWSGPVSNGASFNPTITSNYSVSATNSNSCQNSATTAVVVNALPTVSASASNTFICMNSSITLSGSGASTYTWSSPSGTIANPASFSPTSTASYSVSGTSTAGCTSTNVAAVTVTVNALPTVSANTSTTQVCAGNSVTLNGGGASTYTWSSSTGTIANNTAFSPTSTASYTVSGTSTAGCTSTNAAVVSVTVNPLPTLTISGTALICNGGVASLSVSGAGTYSWSNGATTNTVILSPSSTTPYTVTGTDINSCQNNAVKTVTVSSLPTVSASVSASVICMNNSVTLSGSGANTYTWTASSGTATNNIAFAPATTASYSLAGTSSAGCTSTNAAVVSVTVNPLPTLTITSTSSAICIGGSVALSASGANTYTWTGGAWSGPVSNGASFNPTITSNYSVSATNSNSCQNSATTAVVVNALPTVTANASSTAICINGNLTLSGSGANTYTWIASIGTATNNTAFSPTATASYTVSGTSTAGCTSTNVAAISVTVNPLPIVTASTSTTQLCQNNSVTLSGGGANTYTWTGGASTVTNNIAFAPNATANYSVSGTSTAGCTSTNVAAVTVTVNLLPTVSANTTTTQVCQNNSVTLSGGGANTYTWVASAGAVTNNVAFAPTTTASYTVSGTSTAGCTSTNVAALTVTVNLLPTVSANSSTNQVCQNASVTLNGGGASTYTWAGGASTVTNGVAFSPNSTASYTVSGTSTAGCTSTNVAVISVTVNALPIVTASTSTTQLCQNMSVTLSGSGASTYTWSSPTGTIANNTPFAPAATDTYSLSGTSTAGCTSTNIAVATVTVNLLPILAATASTTQVCPGQSVTLSGSGASTYTWLASAGTVTNNVAFAPNTTASYTVTGTSTAGCTGTNVAALTITVNALPTITASVSNSVVCLNSSITLSGSGAATYTWAAPGAGSVSDGQPFAPPASGVYSLTGTSSQGCPGANTATLAITVNPLPAVSASTSSMAICLGGTTSVSGSGATSYTWSNGVTDGAAFSPTQTASYTVTGTNANSCTNTAVVSITVNPLPALSITSTKSLSCIAEGVTLTVSGASTYSWTSPIANASNNASIAIAPSDTTIYTLKGTDANGCLSTASYTQYVIHCDVAFAISAQVTPVSCGARRDGAVVITPTNMPEPHQLSFTWSDPALCPTNDCASLDSLPIGSYSVRVILTYTANGNFVISDTLSLPVVISSPNGPCDVTVFNGVTPNGDGTNDVLTIKNIDQYTNNKVSVFNRWGTKLFEVNSYNNKDKAWPQQGDIDTLPAGTYFYIVDLGDGSPTIKSWIEVMK